MCRIVQSRKGELSHKLAHHYCQKRYIEEIMLKDGCSFSEPHDYFAAVLNDKIVGTIGIFHRDGETLPLENVFNYKTEEESIEIGRFSLDYSRRDKVREISTKLMTSLFMEILVNHPEKNVYIETHAAICKMIKKTTTIPIELHEEEKAKINWEKVKNEQVDFYTNLDPRVYKINISFNKLLFENQHYVGLWTQMFN